MNDGGSWASLQASRTEKTSERVARTILEDIRARGLGDGDSLGQESALMARLGVGKSSFREALRILEINGLLTVKTGASGGPIVRSPDSRDFGQMWMLHQQATKTTFGQLIAFRVELEPELARQAAEAASPDGIASIRATLDKSAPIDTADAQEYSWSHSSFHSAIFRASDNPILALVADALKNICVSQVTATLFPVNQRQRVIEAHEEVAEAIFAGDGDRAESAMRAHLEHYAEYSKLRYPARLDDVVEWE